MTLVEISTDNYKLLSTLKSKIIFKEFLQYYLLTVFQNYFILIGNIGVAKVEQSFLYDPPLKLFNV